MTADRFVWDGKPVVTIRDLADALYAIHDSATADRFLTEYRAAEPAAAENVGYVIGYLEPAARRAELYEAFGLVHPISGDRP